MERVADYIIRKVNEAGASHIFLITGRGILYLTDAVARNKKIQHISAFHEQGASYAAMAYAAVKGGVSACLVSTGCAAANAVTAALCAYQDNLPVVFISGNHPLSENTRHTGVPIRTYGSQEADIVEIVRTVTKHAVMLEKPDRAVYEVEKALYLAEEGRKGPVWIDVPLDVQNMRIEESSQEHFSAQTWESRESELSEALKQTAREMNAAKRPVLLIGGGARSAAAEIGRIVEKYQIPLAFSPTAADIYGVSHMLSTGAVGSLGGSRAGNFTVQNADYILAAGTKLCTQETGMKHAFARKAKVTVVDIDKKEHTKDGVHIERIIHADVKEFMEGLLYQDIRPADWAWSDKCRHWKEIFSIKKEDFIQKLNASGELDIYSVADMLSDSLPEDAAVITDAGFEELIIPSTVRFRDGQRCLFPAAQGAMGYALPAILGAYAAGREHIVCIVGDGSFMMNMQELQMIKAMDIPAKIIIISNDMYAVIRKRQKDLFRERMIGNDSSNGVPVPDFQKIAGCFGFEYKKITSMNEFREYKDRLFQNAAAEMIEILCTPDQQYLHESYGISEKRKLVRRPIEDMAPFLDRAVIKREMVVDMLEE